MLDISAGGNGSEKTECLLLLGLYSSRTVNRDPPTPNI